MDEVARRQQIELPPDGGVALGLALHMLYFVIDLERAVVRMARFLAPGGGLFIVVTDESAGYTGHALRTFVEASPDRAACAPHITAIEERRRFFSEDRALLAILEEELPERRHRVTVQRQPSRLYGHSLADLMALSAIAALGTVDGIDKFIAARRLLEDQPELVDLRIEENGPRAGMFSVAQPQFVVRLERQL